MIIGVFLTGLLIGAAAIALVIGGSKKPMPKKEEDVE